MLFKIFVPVLIFWFSVPSPFVFVFGKWTDVVAVLLQLIQSKSEFLARIVFAAIRFAAEGIVIVIEGAVRKVIFWSIRLFAEMAVRAPLIFDACAVVLIPASLRSAPGIAVGAFKVIRV